MSSYCNRRKNPSHTRCSRTPLHCGKMCAYMWVVGERVCMWYVCAWVMVQNRRTIWRFRIRAIVRGSHVPCAQKFPYPVPRSRVPRHVRLPTAALSRSNKRLGVGLCFTDTQSQSQSLHIGECAASARAHSQPEHTLYAALWIFYAERIHVSTYIHAELNVCVCVCACTQTRRRRNDGGGGFGFIRRTRGDVWCAVCVQYVCVCVCMCEANANLHAEITA